MAGSRVWHFITCEYPPQPGGVSEYVYHLAGKLASDQDEVHVWCPSLAGDIPSQPYVTVHPTLGSFRLRDLRRTSQQLSAYEAPRCLLVHWVPHGYGYRSLNVGFCLWLWNRVRRLSDELDLMVHEPFLTFSRCSWRQNAAALVHRFMTLILLRSASHVWMSTTQWKSRLEPFALGRRLDFDWLPISSNVTCANDVSAVERVRTKFASGRPLIGHFGTFRPPIAPMLESIIPGLLSRIPNASLLLIGGGSKEFRQRLVEMHPGLRERIHATGFLNSRDPELSACISACDVMAQPFPDGVTSRRTTVMAALAHGKPVVTTDGAFTEPFWKARNAVVLSPVDDTESFVEAVRNTICAPGVGSAGKLLYEECFDIRRVANLVRLRDVGQKSSLQNDPQVASAR